MFLNIYILIILMFFNINFQYIKINCTYISLTQEIFTFYRFDSFTRSQMCRVINLVSCGMDLV